MLYKVRALISGQSSEPLVKREIVLPRGCTARAGVRNRNTTIVCVPCLEFSLCMWYMCTFTVVYVFIFQTVWYGMRLKLKGLPHLRG